MFISNRYDDSKTKLTKTCCFLYYLTFTRLLTRKEIYITGNCKKFGFEQNFFWSFIMNFGFGCSLHFQLRCVLVDIISIWGVILYCFDFKNLNFDKVIQIVKDFTPSCRREKIFRNETIFARQSNEYSNFEKTRSRKLVDCLCWWYQSQT